MAQEEKVLQIRHIIKDQNAELKKTGGIFKLGNLQESDVRNIECVIIDYPKLEYYVLENENSYDVFLRYKNYDTKLEIGNTVDSVKRDYINKDYNSCLSKLLLVLKEAAVPSPEVYELAGLTYSSLGDLEQANDYFRLTNYLRGVKNYNIVNIDKVRERVEKEMKDNKKNNYSQYNYDSDRQIHIDKLTLPDLDEIIDYIEENHLDIETAGRDCNLTDEQIDFVKLIYAREFYKQGDIEKGNAYLKSVEETRGKTSDVTRLCLEARTNKKFFQYRDNNQPKQLALVKPGKRK